MSVSATAADASVSAAGPNFASTDATPRVEADAQFFEPLARVRRVQHVGAFEGAAHLHRQVAQHGLTLHSHGPDHDEAIGGSLIGHVSQQRGLPRPRGPVTMVSGPAISPNAITRARRSRRARRS